MAAERLLRPAPRRPLRPRHRRHAPDAQRARLPRRAANAGPIPRPPGLQADDDADATAGCGAQHRRPAAAAIDRQGDRHRGAGRRAGVLPSVRRDGDRLPQPRRRGDRAAARYDAPASYSSPRRGSTPSTRPASSPAGWSRRISTSAPSSSTGRHPTSANRPASDPERSHARRCTTTRPNCTLAVDRRARAHRPADRRDRSARRRGCRCCPATCTTSTASTRSARCCFAGSAPAAESR